MKRIFITGATGFIGCRLAEIACQLGIDIVALVRTWSRAARLARLPVRMVHGDILNPDSLPKAMEGCDVVFHCAVDNRVGGKAHRRSSVKGTENVMRVALKMGIRRVVHLSSIAVYSFRPGTESATEEAAYRYSGHAYCDGKIDAEKIALRYYREHSLPVTVLRPTIVYGPFGYYTVHTVTLIQEGKMVLVDGGAGVCNSLYVDNLVEAMLLAAEHDGAVGEVFHLSDASAVTWKEFIEAHARGLGDSNLPLPQMTAQEIAVARARTRGTVISSLKQVLRLIREPRTQRALGSIPIVKHSVQMGKSIIRRLHLEEPTRRLLYERLLAENTSASPNGSAEYGSRPPMSRTDVEMFSIFSNVVISIEKARKILNYNPSINFTEGMKRTAAWIKWARL